MCVYEIQMNREKLMKMANTVRTGGKGTVRRYGLLKSFIVNLDFLMFCFFSKHFGFHFRKKKAVHKTTTTDDKRLQSTLKRVGVNSIPAIEEVNIFKDDVVIQFINPKGESPKLVSFLKLQELVKTSLY